MKDVEKILMNKKVDIDIIQVPEELESRLNNALASIPVGKVKRKNWRTGIAAACIVLFLIGCNIDTLAFYGKRLIGYDTLMNSTLKALNEQEKGQLIEKSYTFSNGVTLMLDGVMLDDNQLLVFYTIKLPSGSIEDARKLGALQINGLISSYISEGGHGEMNEERTEIKWIENFKPPLFFEKTLKLSFAVKFEDGIERGEISFKLDRNKAMGYTLKKNINISIAVDETDIKFKTIVAAPTSTVIKGSLQSIVELAMDDIKGERFRPGNLDVRLIANGQEVQRQGSSMSTDMKGMHFTFEYDTLPPDIEALQLKLVSFAADHDVKKEFELIKSDKEQMLEILGQEVAINNIREADGSTYITITTEESTLLSKVYLIADNKQIELEETNSDSYEKLPDKIMHTRILVFKGVGDNLKLDVRRMSYTKVYNKLIDIPIE